ncbi:hypothetical protein [Micromonospora sp. NPDC005299]|uniref:hypothetical protein n=1 Tax=Micromonospora sp. NPDC005299 TaxID=3364231 RepID=UPI0036983B92
MTQEHDQTDCGEHQRDTTVTVAAKVGRARTVAKRFRHCWRSAAIGIQSVADESYGLNSRTPERLVDLLRRLLT